MKRIVTITLNPALDITTAVESLVSGRKLRCKAPRIDAGGGGVNVSRAIAKLGGTSLAFLALAGPTGETLRRILETEGIDYECIEAEGDTRQSFVVHEKSSGEQYRFILPGPCWTAAGFETAIERLGKLIRPGDLVVVSGSMPPGLTDNAAARIEQLATRMDAQVVADISGPALKVLVQGTLQQSLTLIMNATVAAELAGGRLDVPQARDFCRTLVDRGAAETAVVTLEEAGAVAVRASETWHVFPPAVDVVSKVGAGDSFAAGLVIGLAKTWPLSKALTYAMASAASAVTTPATDLCTKEGTEAIIASVSCHRL